LKRSDTIRALAIAGVFALLNTLHAAERPRIGLVLEGGGALGFAHIGVLEWLEQNRVPIDAVAGTSMGGLVGGLYAAGLTTAEIRAIVSEADWDILLRGRVPFPNLTYRRKEDRVDFPNRLEFGLRHGFTLPGGLNAGHELSLIFDRKLLPYYDLKSFDDLPIPFRCVSTDLDSGQKKVFSSGSLPQALRATMSIPAVFTPVTIDGHLYVDGGTLDNLPVDVARNMGVDMVIAVYLDNGPADPKAMNSLLGVAGRTLTVMIAANEFESMKNADILLTADVRNATASDFKKSEELVPRGFAAAEAKRKLLVRLSLPEGEWEQHRAQQVAKRRTHLPTPQFVAVQGVSDLAKEQILEQLEDVPGRPLETKALERDLALLNGLDTFNSLNYTFRDREGQTGLEIAAAEKSYGPPYLRLGLDLDGSDINDVRFGLSARLLNLNFGSPGAELRTDGSFGSSYRLASEYYRPLHTGSCWFLAPHAYALRYPFDVYNRTDRLSNYIVDRYGFGADVGYSFGRRAELRIGQDLAWYKNKLKIGFPLVPNATERVAISQARFQYLGTDATVVPRQGIQLLANTQWFSRRPLEGGFALSEVRLAAFQRVSANGSVFLTASGGTAYGATSLGVQSFSLGGPTRVGAYGRNELLGNRYFLFQGGYEHELLRLNPLLGDAVYGLIFAEGGRVGHSVGPAESPIDGSVAVVAKTAIGPLFLGGSLGDGNRRKWWFGIGRVF